MTKLTYTSSKTAKSLNLCLSGNLIHVDGLKLYRQILHRLEDVNNVIIDLAQLKKIDLTGLNALMVCQSHLSGEQIGLQIKVGSNKKLREFMKTASVAHYLL